MMTGLALHACAFAVVLPLYSAESIEAWVVDEDTGQPLEGVIVAAHWELIGPFESYPVGQMMVMETVTDANGHLFFPAWGPKPRPLEGHLDNADPRLLLFKSGYKALWLENEVREKSSHSAVRRSVWNGQTIKLEKFEGSLEQYAQHLGTLDNIWLNFAFFHHDCSWKYIPHMLVAMHREKMRFKEKGLRDSSYYPHTIQQRDEEMSPTEAAKCGSMQEFLRSYLP
jgi:hypothetical protein